MNEFTQNSVPMGPDCMSMNVTDHRTAARFALQIPVEILFDDGAKASVFTRDVSASGVFLKVNKELELKDQIRFLIAFPKEITTSCRIVTLCDGTIVRKEPAGEWNGVAVKIERYEFLGSKP